MVKAGAKALAERARARPGFVRHMQAAGFHVQAGLNDEALDWLEKAFLIHDPNLPYLTGNWGEFAHLRDNPRI